jgi:acetolactate synthase-1/3 small subunit
MWLQVNEELKLEQVIKQLQKLPDVLSVERHATGHEVFTGLAVFM